MTSRAAAVAQTRARIVEATVAAHRDLGVQATSWEEIARRAGVGVGTVYRHFHSLEELLPACGEIVARTLALPTGDQIPALFDGMRSTRQRIERLVETAFGAYERGAPFIENTRRERKDLPYFERRHQYIEGTLDALTREALRPIEPQKRDIDIARVLTDLATWKALTDRGLTTTEAIDTAAELIERGLRPTKRANKARRRELNDPRPRA
jgi:AcrR family transcriptional regulator